MSMFVSRTDGVLIFYCLLIGCFKVFIRLKICAKVETDVETGNTY
jgi:lipoprotein